jgi:hypothetical protein
MIPTEMLVVEINGLAHSQTLTETLGMYRSLISTAGLHGYASCMP